MAEVNRPNIDTFFKVIEDTMVFTGNHLEVRIPMRYRVHEALDVDEHVKTLAIFEMIVNHEFNYGLLLPNIIRMVPSKISRSTIDGVEYQVCEFFNGDKFMLSTTVLKENHISLMMYNEFISLGNIPKFITYDNIALLFDTAEKMCDVNLKTPHAVFEMIYSHLFRDPDNLYIKYRFTDKIKPPVFIGANNVAFGPESTTAKLIGAYFNDGINSALVNASDKHYDIEDLLRT